MPLVSVLLPSRARPASLRATITGLLDLAVDPARVEILVAADDDDDDTLAAGHAAGADTVLTSVRRGYERLHEYVNDLAGRAHGTWLLLWNDDAVILTDGWDEVLAAESAGLAVLHTGSNQGPILNPFPIFTRELVDLLGHVSVSNHCDSYLESISRQAGIERRVGIDVRHDRFDLTGLHDDQTFADAQAGYRTAEFHAPQVQDQIAEDVAKIRAVLGG